MKKLMAGILVVVMLVGAASLVACGSNYEGHMLVGTWGYEANETYQYIFRANGRGRRGFENRLESFRWASGGAGRIRITAGGVVEGFTYTMEDEVLILVTRDEFELTYRFVRIED